MQYVVLIMLLDFRLCFSSDNPVETTLMECIFVYVYKCVCVYMYNVFKRKLSTNLLDTLEICISQKPSAHLAQISREQHLRINLRNVAGTLISTKKMRICHIHIIRIYCTLERGKCALFLRIRVLEVYARVRNEISSIHHVFRHVHISIQFVNYARKPFARGFGVGNAALLFCYPSHAF